MTLLWGLRRACPLVAVILLTFFLSLASAITFDGVTFTEDSANNGLSGTQKFTVAWTSATFGSPLETHGFAIAYDGAIDSPDMIEGATVTTTMSCSVSVSFADRGMNIGISACIPLFPMAANSITLTLSRPIDTSIPCNSYTPFQLTSTRSILQPSPISANFYWTMCPLSFTNPLLTSSLTLGVPKVTFSWSEFSKPIISDSITLKLEPDTGARVFSRITSSGDLVVFEGVTLRATKTDDTITLTFTFSAGVSLPASSAIDIPSEIIGPCTSAGSSGVYALSAASGTITGLPIHVTVNLGSCPQMRGTQLSMTTNAASSVVFVTVSWDSFISTALPSLKLSIVNAHDTEILGSVVTSSVTFNTDTSMIANILFESHVHTIVFSNTTLAVFSNAGADSFTFQVRLAS